MTRAELEGEREFLLGSLRDLDREHEGGEIDGADYRSLRDDYTTRAAAVLRAIKEIDHGPAAHRSPGRGPGRGPVRAPARRAAAGQARTSRQRVVSAVLVAGMAGLALVGVFALATDRGPGQPLSGSVPAGIAGQLAQAHDLEAQGEALEAIKLYDRVLSEDPANPEALAYRGWLLRLAGLFDQAQDSLNRAVASDPSYPDARFFRGLLLFRDRGDALAALADFEAFLASGPPPGAAEAVQGVLAEARAAAASPAGPPG